MEKPELLRRMLRRILIKAFEGEVITKDVIFLHRNFTSEEMREAVDERLGKDD